MNDSPGEPPDLVEAKKRLEREVIHLENLTRRHGELNGNPSEASAVQLLVNEMSKQASLVEEIFTTIQQIVDSHAAIRKARTHAKVPVADRSLRTPKAASKRPLPKPTSTAGIVARAGALTFSGNKPEVTRKQPEVTRKQPELVVQYPEQAESSPFRVFTVNTLDGQGPHSVRVTPTPSALVPSLNTVFVRDISGYQAQLEALLGRVCMLSRSQSSPLMSELQRMMTDEIDNVNGIFITASAETLEGELETLKFEAQVYLDQLDDLKRRLMSQPTNGVSQRPNELDAMLQMEQLRMRDITQLVE